jgi:4-amino-4-deoxy-L-arabinose transferase-like glycosyltransferase
MTSRVTKLVIDIRWPLLFGLVVLLALGIGWTGYTSSDDASYYNGAVRWLADPPYAGDDHWTTRFPVVLSLAATLALLGRGFAAFGAAAMFWYVALILVFGLFAARIGGRRAGWIAAILAATMPVIADQASTVGCDLPEALFLIGGTWLLSGCIDEPVRAERRAFVAGISFGLAILCRETALLALAGLLPLFLLGRPVSRKILLIAGAGAASLLLAEMIFQAALTGDPLRRYMLAFNHDSTIDRAANREGNLLVHPALDPLLVLLVNNEFALLFWMAVAALAAGVHRLMEEGQKRRLLLLVALGAAAFLLVGALATKLVLNPRYFTVTALAATMIVAVWLARMSPWPRAALLGGAVAANLLMLSVENKHPRWPAEALVIAAAAHPGELLFTDQETRHRADQPLAFANLRNAHAGQPSLDRLYLASEDAGKFGTRPLARYPAPPTPLGWWIGRMGYGDKLPDRIARRLLRPMPAMLLWRVGS